MRRGRFSVLALKDDRVEQCLRSCGSEPFVKLCSEAGE